MPKKLLLIIIAALPMVFAGCPELQPGIVPVPKMEIEKWAVKTDGREYAQQVACYIDVEKYNPLNAGDYYLGDIDGPTYFDFVILGAAQLKRPAGTRIVTLYIPPGLQYVLDNRQTYIEPLRYKGIKVLLGITGGQDDVSFGNIILPEDYTLTKEEYYLLEFGEYISNFVALYRLDGVEFFDTNTARLPLNINTYPYPDGTFEGHNIDKYTIDDYPDGDGPRLKIDAWGMMGGGKDNIPYSSGSRQISYLALILREASNGYFSDIADSFIFVREINFGAYLSAQPKLFTRSSYYVNYFVNSDYSSFGSSNPRWECLDCREEIVLRGDFPVCPYCFSDNMEEGDHQGKSTIPEVPLDQYGPLAIDLGGITPPLSDPEGNDIEGYTQLFLDSDDIYGVLFYNDLMPASEESDPRFGGLTQDKIMSISSRMIYKDNPEVVRDGGNRPKAW
jgi:hypothetical protein